MYWLFLSLPPPSRWHQQPDPIVRPQVTMRPDFRERRTRTPASKEWNTRPFGKCSTPRRPDITIIPRSGLSMYSGYFSYHRLVLQSKERWAWQPFINQWDQLYSSWCESVAISDHNDSRLQDSELVLSFLGPSLFVAQDLDPGHVAFHIIGLSSSSLIEPS